MKKFLASLFLFAIVGLAASLVWPRKPAASAEAAPPAPGNPSLHEAAWYDKLAGNLVHCRLCPNSCRLADGQIGMCRARKNVGGKLYSLVYGQLASVHVDPIEKKPFFHVLPGAKAFSLATPGCNMRCLFCQNWEISQAFPWRSARRRRRPKRSSKPPCAAARKPSLSPIASRPSSTNKCSTSPSSPRRKA